MADLRDRTRIFGVKSIRLCDDLPRKRSSDVAARQLIKCATSVGAHYREAIRARSSSEYVSKLNGGLMELEESAYWLEVIQEVPLAPAERVVPLRDEASQLTAIFVTLILKAKANPRDERAT